MLCDLPEAVLRERLGFDGKPDLGCFVQAILEVLRLACMNVNPKSQTLILLQLTLGEGAS